MKKLCTYFPCIFFVLQVSAQMNSKNSYKANGYILQGTDTVKGWIAVPVSNEEIDYYSLTFRITFIDSSDHQNNYKPKDITGFGFQENDEDLGNYISVTEADGLSKAKFLRIMLRGKISLFKEKLDRSTYRDLPSINAFGQPSAAVMAKSNIYKTNFYVRQNNDALVKIKVNSKTGMLIKKDLKKALDSLPDSFKDSEEEIDISGFMDILLKLNATL